MDHNIYSSITPEILALAELSEEAGTIDPALYTKYNVNRGLRDLNGKGVLTGLTNISDVRAKEMIDGELVPAQGRLFYRGYDIKDLVLGFTARKQFGYEEITYLLLFNKLPTEKELAEFTQLLSDYRTLPTHFVRDIIMKAPSKDMMNTLSRSVLTLYSASHHLRIPGLQSLSQRGQSVCPSAAAQPVHGREYSPHSPPRQLLFATRGEAAGHRSRDSYGTRRR